MKSPSNFIVKPSKGKRYDNTVEWEGVEFITHTSEEDHSSANRKAIVVEVPIGYEGPIKKGDTLLVHHNVFKFYNDMRGRRKSGKSFFKEDLFFVDTEQFYMYHNGTQWKAHDRYCFVAPVEAEESYIYKPFTYEPLMGIMKYPNSYMQEHGILEGTKVSFTPDSEYAFKVDGEIMYRIFDHQITLQV